MTFNTRILLPLVLLLTGLVSLPAAEQPTCAVLLFDAKAGISRDEAEFLTERFAIEFGKRDAYQLISRSKMNEVLELQKFARTDNCSAAECAIEAGKLLSAQFMVYGSLGKIGGTYSVNAALVSIETGKITSQASVDVKGDLDELLSSGMLLVARRLAGGTSAGPGTAGVAGGTPPGAVSGGDADFKDLMAQIQEKEAEAQRMAEEKRAAERRLAEELARRKGEFEKQYAAYLKIAASAHADDGMKRVAWRRITEAWAVKDAGAEPQGLTFDETTGLLQVTGLDGRTGESMAVELGGGVKMEFVWIPALKMWVGKYEVTNGEYRKFKPDHNSGEFNGHSLNGDRQPVVRVNFDDAQAFAGWLTEQGRRAGRLPDGYRFRLPSEQEWMTFAQCGDGREYPWGNDWPPRSGQAGNYCGQETGGQAGAVIDGYNDGHPVACDVEQSWANPWGLYGVGGNAWECCASDNSGAAFGAWRGASCYHSIQDSLRCSFRCCFDGSSRLGYIGFRLVLAR